MTEARVKALLEKVELLETKAIVLHHDAAEIKKLLQEMAGAAPSSTTGKGKKSKLSEEDIARRLAKVEKTMYKPR